MTQTQLADAIAKALAGMNSKKSLKANTRRKGKKGKGREKLTDAEKAVYAAKNDTACVEAFTKAGYADVQPRVNVLTYDKWVAQGRRVIKGQKGVVVGPFRLFHVTQTAVENLADAKPANEAAA